MSISVSANNPVTVSTTVDTWVDMPSMTAVVNNTGRDLALILVNVGGTSSPRPSSSVVAYRLTVDGEEKTRMLMSYENDTEVVPATLVHLENLSRGEHTIKVQWSGAGRACVGNSTRTLVIADIAVASRQPIEPVRPR